MQVVDPELLLGATLGVQRESQDCQEGLVCLLERAAQRLKESLLLLPDVHFHRQTFTHVQLVETNILRRCKNPDKIENKLLWILAIE